MSLSASCEMGPQKRTLSSLLAGRVVKRPKQEDARRLQEAALQLLEQQLDLRGLLREVGNRDPGNIFSTQNVEQKQAGSEGATAATAGSLLASELRRRASQLGVPTAGLSVKMTLERLMEIAGSEEEDQNRGLLSSSKRVQLCLLLESSRELLSQGALCPKLLWQEYRRDQRLPHLEVVYHLHAYNILTLKYIIESDQEARLWLVSGMKSLCGWTPPQRDEETKRVQQEVLSTVVGVLVGSGFELSQEPAAADRRASLLCCSVLDDMLFWLLDTVEKSAAVGAELWIEIFDASLCAVSASGETVQRFFTHSLTQTLTYKPRLTVSDAIALQNEWTFAKANRLLTSLFRKLAVVFSVEQLLCHLQRVLETHEVNWKHVLCFLSTLLVYNPCAQLSLRELLSRLLSSAFEGYDLENMITAFLLARQGALEGPAIFPSYSNWFKMSFGGGSGYHASSKKSLVFLLKFLSDLVPFEPSQYLKVHILQPPYVRVKHRSLLMEYISLAKTRLADLKESVEDMGLYEDVSGAGGASLQPQCQAAQDVEKAVSLFESTGRISATVMEASIFRRPYFLAWFLSALLTPRTLPVKADARMSFIEALKKADKIPAAQYSSYVESCQKQRQQNGGAVCLDTNDEPLEVLKIQLQEFTELLVEGNDGELSAQLSRISHTLSAIFPGRPDEPIGRTVIELHTSGPPSPELHVKAVNMILRNFCQCVLDASRANPPNKQSPWASRFVSALLGNTQLLSGLIHGLWDLFHNQAALLSAAHLLGLAAFVVHLHACMSHGPLVRLVPPTLPEPVGVGEALSSALVCSTHANMLFCVRLCVAAVCYGICRGDSLPQQQQQDYILNSLYKKLLYLIPRLSPEARRTPITAGGPIGDHQEESPPGLWISATDANGTWRKTAWHLWRHPAFRQLENTPQYQLSFSEWLAVELRVQRSEDALSDPERQEYQQWACWELYLSRPEEQGGCGGDTRILCSHLLSAIMDQQLSNQNLEKLDHRGSETGTCLPDILSRLQEFVYDMEVTHLSGSSRPSSSDFLLELLCQRCSSSAPPSISGELSQQHTLNAWNRVLLALPAVLLVKVKSEGGRPTLECDTLIEHVNQHQRKACSPAGLLSCHLTLHLLRGVVGASARCGRPGEEVNKAWSQISLRCPLLLVSTAHWWERVSPVLSSLWRRLCDGEPLPEQLQLLADCQNWACSLEKGLPSAPVPTAGALLLAASLHRAWGGRGHDDQGFTAALNVLQPERSTQHRQVLVFLLFLCVQDHLTSLLYPQERSRQGAAELCSNLLLALVDSADWLLVFQSNERGVYQPIAMVTSDEWTRLMPWAFYSLLLQQSAELLQRAALCPGFLGTAVLCYVGLLQLRLEGRVPPPTAEPHQMEPSRILSRAKQFLLRAIPQTPPTALSSSRLRRLESQCADLDPEVAAALSMHLDPHSLSPEMDFL
ncbi:Fanconi anemia group A protein isoform X2 [Cyclopterus lumpus]|uniref:Fanconi anemia group A protein isoform X2 n=1 Tax=Cyclopterus lumpus TaxID=8103 RepID=UPI001486B25B|nr:Fanconi anemia group A protein isoform X2 [Cyclopterus lumpus]